MTGDGEGDNEGVRMEEVKERLVFMCGTFPELCRRGRRSLTRGGLASAVDRSRMLVEGCLRRRLRFLHGHFSERYSFSIFNHHRAIAMKQAQWSPVPELGRDPIEHYSSGTDDLGQSYVASGKHGEIPEVFPLPIEASIMKAAAGWAAHCVAVIATLLGALNTKNGEVYTWGWRECIPSGKVFGDPSTDIGLDKEVFERHNSFLPEQVSSVDGKGGGDESTKRRRISSFKQSVESLSSGDENLSQHCLVLWH
ncbi:regulator of chromosome condensation (RCC1) family protein [Actinidia rufa]|uniref:Regulator of chromosome condensation (RCC1) family protein n=1 Tax=Actinidia rufa TaxID=165716 RepID=A0A7J0DKE4_9ERIC|nr:regulator of chromosome condensation (RCC1) family protein [Actinidia rufa]